MSSSWAKIEKSEPVKLEEIMAEEVAKNVQTKQEKKGPMKIDDDKISTADEFVWVTDTASEGIIGEDYASELNEEYDQLDCLEENCGSSCIDNCCRLSLNIESDSENEEIYDIWNEEDYWGTSESASVSRNVFKGNKKVETAELATARGGKSTSKLSSKVFNNLNVPLYNEEFLRYKVHRDKKKRPTTKSRLCIDQHAWHLICEMLRDKVILKVVGVLSFDEDSVMLRAIQSWQTPYKGMHRNSPIRCAIKVFKINSKLDKGFAMACLKAEKEVANYERLKAADVPCQDVIAHKDHVIIAYYEGIPIKYISWHFDTHPHLYETVRDLMKGFYEANLIHTNLSEHNIVQQHSYRDSYRYFITNVGQCVDSSHKDAFHILFKGCQNLAGFLKRREVTDKKATDPDVLFKYITGYSFLNRRSFSKLQRLKTMNKPEGYSQG